MSGSHWQTQPAGGMTCIRMVCNGRIQSGYYPNLRLEGVLLHWSCILLLLAWVRIVFAKEDGSLHSDPIMSSVSSTSVLQGVWDSATSLSAHVQKQVDTLTPDFLTEADGLAKRATLQSQIAVGLPIVGHEVD